jgi:hypothetical protein
VFDNSRIRDLCGVPSYARGENGGHVLDGSFTRNFFAAAAAAAVALAFVQVASVDHAPRRHTSYTWDTAVDEVRTDIRVTVARLRQERDERKAILTQMGYDLRMLDQALSGGNPQGLGR